MVRPCLVLDPTVIPVYISRDQGIVMDLTEKAALLRIVYQGHERRDVDYKRSMPWDKDTKYGLIKDIMAFANYGGGYIVIGVDEDRQARTMQPDGITPEHHKTWEVTEVCNSLNLYSDPPIDLELLPVENNEERKKFLFLRIPQHGTTPHLCTRDKGDASGNKLLRKAALYYRSSNKSCAEISSISDYRELIRRCVIKDGESLVKDIASIIGNAAPKPPSSGGPTIDPFTEMDRFQNRQMREIGEQLD